MMEFWTKVAALAAVGQVAVLIATAVFVWRYLQETTELRRTAQQQAAIANEQLEAQMRPALVVRLYGDHLLVNVGSGPALNLQVADVVWGGRQRAPALARRSGTTRSSAFGFLQKPNCSWAR